MDDSISRQAAIRWVKTECNPYGKPTLEFESGKRVIEHLENMPPAQPDSGLQSLAEEIARFKRCVKSENSDYLTGYLSALSAVEGMIAERREVTT